MTSFNGRARHYASRRSYRLIRPGSFALAILMILLAAALTASPALALPEGRVYEKVSPLFKGGFGVNKTLAVEPGGEAVAFQSVGVFAGAPNAQFGSSYQAFRSASGWSTVALAPPSSIAPFASLSGFSPSLGASLWELYPGTQNHNPGKVLQFAAHASGAPDTAAGFDLLGPALTSADGRPVDKNHTDVSAFSADLCHVVVETLSPLLPGAANSEQDYDVSAGCHGESSYTRFVALNSAGGLLAPGPCTPHVGGFNAVSRDGSDIFFLAGDPENCRLSQVFVRVGGVRTLEVSKPLAGCAGGEVPCPSWGSRPAARLWGASEDGSRVFFTTAAPLDPAHDLDAGNDLYMARVGCPGEASGCEAGQRVVTGLTQISHDPHAGQAADVQGVVSIAPDGSRVYFVARAVLSEAANQQGQAALAGADNLYVYDSATGQTAFVGDLCSGPQLSGAVAAASCPADLEEEVVGEERRDDVGLWEAGSHAFAQTAGADGRFLVFSTFARLLGAGPLADGDDAQDVYRYDAQTGQLLRVSLGEGGADANGNRNDGEAIVGQLDELPARAADARVRPPANQLASQEHNVFARAASEDGSRIVFSTLEPLSPHAENGQFDVYEWHDGVVSLVSCGCSTGPDREPVITPSGRDLFFTSSAALVPEDTDGALDVYDARLGGGFAPVEAPVQRCEGDACQGPLTNPAPLLVPGSAVQTPGEDLIADQSGAPIHPKPPVTAKPTHRKCAKKKRRSPRCKRRGRSSSRRHGGRAGAATGRGGR
jgi:hypothetical protein